MPRPFIPALLLALLTLSPARSATAVNSDLILSRAWARIDTCAFEPYRVMVTTEMKIWKKDELQEQIHERSLLTRWSPDSTEAVKLDAAPDDDEKEGGGGMSIKSASLDQDFRDRHAVEFQGLVDLEGQAAAHFSVEPHKKAKGDLVGDLWLDPSTGACLATSFSPAKRPFGVKEMRFRTTFADAEGRDLPVRIDIHTRIKIPLLANLLMEGAIVFEDLTFLE